MNIIDDEMYCELAMRAVVVLLFSTTWSIQISNLQFGTGGEGKWEVKGEGNFKCQAIQSIALQILLFIFHVCFPNGRQNGQSLSNVCVYLKINYKVKYNNENTYCVVCSVYVC